MRKARYYYSPVTCSYERVKASPWLFVVRTGLLFSCAFVLACFMVRYYRSCFSSPKEIELLEDNKQLQAYYNTVQQHIEKCNTLLVALQERDDTFRLLLGKEPLSVVERNAGIGGVNKYAHLCNNALISQTLSKLDQLTSKLTIQKKSCDSLLKFAQQSERKFKSMPTFPPVSKKHLKRISGTFGMRFHPIFKIPKMHEGVDFAAPIRAPIYAAADGRVKWIKSEKKGFGNHLLIEHDNGFQTLYAHMHTIDVEGKQRVVRGQQIGLVGNSGHSTAPHLHYEVYHNGNRVDPLLYLVEGLTDVEYEEIRRKAAQQTQTLCY
ncbi:M23 family metallopeptidase [Candidatus Cardinium hertigii]|uniref:Murein DD-endopeptidase MepM n=1 Tax=Candidatus Cardinium hertigii TaxID=247481 RepID=A0A2Z3L8P8_9BACT|nr:M23 family metallopeptidase [Candidatus Cardinium hertigii]AWN81779.1 Murein DD-endopeptidase MepM [Candidatus Cardinium hertigii]